MFGLLDDGLHVLLNTRCFVLIASGFIFYLRFVVKLNINLAVEIQKFCDVLTPRTHKFLIIIQSVNGVGPRFQVGDLI